MTPNKLPPLPEPEFIRPDRPFKIFTADQMLAYGKLCSAEAFQLYVDANEARIDAEKALRQSQSQPAGAVADGPVFYVQRTYDCNAGEDRGEIIPTLPANLIGKRVRLVPVDEALQADAREKGEAEYPEAAIVCAEAYQVVGCLLDQLGLFETEEGQKILDNLSQQRLVHKDVLPWGWTATQPALASEAVDWRALYRLQTSMRYMDNMPDLTIARANKMADDDIASMERFASTQHGESKP